MRIKTRAQLIREARRRREEIAQYFRDVEHWNNGRGKTEGVIPADPGGQLKRIASALDVMLEKEVAA